jgi:hypothetical protein
MPLDDATCFDRNAVAPIPNPSHHIDRPTLSTLLDRIDAGLAVQPDDAGRLQFVLSVTLSEDEVALLPPAERLTILTVMALQPAEVAAFLRRIGHARGSATDWEQAASETVHDLLTPMVRIVMEEAEGEIEPEQAVSMLLQVIRARHDPKAVALLAEDAAKAVWRALGMPVVGRTPEERLATDVGFYRRRLRKWAKRLTIHIGDVLRLIDPRRSPYLAPATSHWVAQAEQAATEFLTSAYAVNDTGAAVALQHLHAAAVRRRFATVRALLHAMDERRKADAEMVPVFITLIPEGEATPNAGNEANRISKFDPHKWNCVRRRQDMSKTWHAKCLTPLRAYLKRRGRDVMGIWTHEGTKGGVLHKHVLLWLHRDDVDVLCRYLTGGGWPTLETHPCGTVEERRRNREYRVFQTVDRKTGNARPDDWTIGPRRGDADAEGAFVDYRVNIRILAEKQGDAALASIVNYVMKYVTKNASIDPEQPTKITSEARFARAHEARSFGLFGLPRGILTVWQEIATAKEAPEGSLLHRLRGLILSRRDAEALEILIKHADAWRKADAAGKRLAKLTSMEARPSRAPAALREHIANRRATARQEAEASIASAPDARLAMVREPRVTRLGACYRATTGLAELDGDAVRQGLRTGERNPPLEAVRYSTATGETWAVTTHPDVSKFHGAPPVPADEVDEWVEDAARAAANQAVARLLSDRAQRVSLEGGRQVEQPVRAMALVLALGRVPAYRDWCEQIGSCSQPGELDNAS